MGRIRYGLHQQNPDVDRSQDLMRQELEKVEQMNRMDAEHFTFDFKDFNPV